MERRRSRPGTLATLVGVLVALAVVALAARGGVSAGDAGSRRPSDGFLDAAFSLLLVAMALTFVAVVLLFVLNRDVFRSTPEPLRRRRDSRRTIVVVLLLVLAVSLFVRYAGSREGTVELPPSAPPPEEEATGDAADAAQRYDPEFAWLPVAVVLALAAAGVAAAWWSARARRRSLGLDGDAPFAEALDDVLAETLDDLRAEADPRRAVIAAYARLERVLGAYGVPRRPAEAPLEFLRRMLAEADVGPAAAERLTRLFERARFSQHEVGPEMKEEAIDALETVREDLRLAELRARGAGGGAGARARAGGGAVTERALRAAVLPVLASVALAAALTLAPGRRELALHVYALVLAALALGWLVGFVRRANPVASVSIFDAGLRRRAERRTPVAELDRIERELSMASSTAFDLHFRLRPRLQRIARGLLASRRGIDLAAQPDAARRALGEDAWALVRPDAPPPRDRSERGLDLERAAAAVAALERI